MDCSTLWVKYLPWAEFAYNTSFHGGARFTPFRLVYGHDPPTISSYVRRSTDLEAVEAELVSRDEILKQLRQNLTQAQHRMKTITDNHRTDVVL